MNIHTDASKHTNTQVHAYTWTLYTEIVFIVCYLFYLFFIFLLFIANSIINSREQKDGATERQYTGNTDVDRVEKIKNLIKKIIIWSSETY